MRNKFWIVLLVVSLGINIGFLLHWFWPKIVPGRSAGNAKSQCGWHNSPIRRNLGLNTKQGRLMEDDRQQALAQVKPLQDELRQQRRELFTLLTSQSRPATDLDVILNEIARLQSGIEKIYILHSLKVKGYLSPQQLQKYDELFEQGFCPGMMSKKACLPGQLNRQDQSVPVSDKK